VELKKSNMDTSNSDDNKKKSNRISRREYRDWFNQHQSEFKGNPLDGYWQEYGTDPHENPMGYNPFMARLGLVILVVLGAALAGVLVIGG